MEWVPGAPLAAVRAPEYAVPTTGETAAIVGGGATPRRRIGETELQVSPLALSGNVFGWIADAAVSRQVLDAYAELGGNLLDTADAYASGRSESIIGTWLCGRHDRDRFVVATKVGKGPDHPGLDAPAIYAAVHDSLRRLQTDRIDLLYLHVDDPEVPFEETLLAVDELIRAGKVRYFGASHHTGERLIEARIACGQLGVAPLTVLQNEYNLLARHEYEGGLAHVAARQGLSVMPRFALASGFLTGKYRSRSAVAHSPRRDELTRYANRRGFRVLAALDRVAAAHDASVATIAIAWLLSKPNVVAPVASASHPEQVFDLMAAADIRLSRHDVTELDHASR
jgi:aryl-alcohol dehydrogenase-like predicted oxidoreductase